MITPLEIHRASRRWHCGWLVAWTRLRYQREFWQARPDADPAARSWEAADTDVPSQRRA
jgi:hypothetical protein